MIVLPDVTLARMTEAVRRLADEGYFDHRAAIAAPDTRT